MTDITVPDALTDRIQARIQYTDFESVDDYVEFVLLEVINHVEHEEDETHESTVSDEEVQSRLQSLGYLEE